MPFAPEVQQLIEQVERISERPVHVMEEADLKARATVMPARGGAGVTTSHLKSLNLLIKSQKASGPP